MKGQNKALSEASVSSTESLDHPTVWTESSVDVAQMVGMSSRSQMRLELVHSLQHQRLGEVMVALGLITESQVDEVLKRQQKKGLPFGETALKLRYVKRRQLEDALAVHFGHPYTSNQSTGVSRDLITTREPFGECSEALRVAGKRLMSSWWEPGQNRLAIMSGSRGEGRSHLAANLAVVLSQFRHRVLLIDADLRRPRQHQIFGIPLNPGLTRMLCGVASQETLRSVSFLPFLDIITAGPKAPNPADLISRTELQVLLDKAGNHYDVVIIDTPPAGASMDAETIAAYAGAALTIVAPGRSRYRTVREMLRRLKDQGIKSAGLIANHPR